MSQTEVILKLLNQAKAVTRAEEIQLWRVDKSSFLPKEGRGLLVSDELVGRALGALEQNKTLQVRLAEGAVLWIMPLRLAEPCCLLLLNPDPSLMKIENASWLVSLIMQVQQDLDGAQSGLSQFVGEIAHEINNPLETINSYLTKLRRLAERGPSQSPLMAEDLLKVQAVVHRLAKIVKGWRALSSEDYENQIELVSVEQILNESLGYCEQRLKLAQIQLQLGPIPPGRTLECNPVQISQVVLNLINNACDAIVDSQPAERLIAVEVHDKELELEFSVTNSGTEILEPVRQKLFQPFFTTKGPHKGMGLGLTVSKSIVEAHHGRIGLESIAGKTRFYFVIPKQAAK